MCSAEHVRNPHQLQMTSIEWIVKKMANTFGSNMNRMASTNFSSVNSSTGIGAGPTPLACTLSPQNGWSPKNGTIVVGH